MTYEKIKEKAENKKILIKNLNKKQLLSLVRTDSWLLTDVPPEEIKGDLSEIMRQQLYKNLKQT